MRSAGHDRLKRPGHNPLALALDIVPRGAPGLVVRVLSRIRVLNRSWPKGDNRTRSASSMATPSSRKASTATPMYRVLQRTIAFTTSPKALKSSSCPSRYF